MHSSKWLLRPTRSLYCENEETNKELYQLIEPDGDQELRSAVKSAKTDTVSEPRCDIGTPMVFLVELDRSQFQMLQIEHISGHTFRPLDNFRHLY
jgi:hypothetical protein